MSKITSAASLVKQYCDTKTMDAKTQALLEKMIEAAQMQAIGSTAIQICDTLKKETTLDLSKIISCTLALISSPELKVGQSILSLSDSPLLKID